LSNFVNNIRYPSDHVFEIIAVENNEAFTNGFTDESNIGNILFKDLEHGMILKNGTTVKKIQSLKTCNRDSFYFLHIARTSGTSLQEQLKNTFQDRQSYINTIQYIDESDMLNSKFISGHFAMYPFKLFEKNNKKLHGITIVRDPVDRAISCLTFMSKLYDKMYKRKTDLLTSKDIDNFLSDLNFIEGINNFQARSLTSSLDENLAKRYSSLYMDRTINRFQFVSIMSSNCNFIAPGNDGNSWKENIDKFDIIGLVEKRELFLNKLSIVLEKNNYSTKLIDIKRNESDFKVESIKKNLTKDQLNKIIELNQYDFELYDFIMTNKGVWEC